MFDGVPSADGVLSFDYSSMVVIRLSRQPHELKTPGSNPGAAINGDKAEVVEAPGC